MLTENNFVLTAMHNYDNPTATTEEFEADLKRLMYVKKLIIRYVNNNDLKERLLLNHIIVLYNVFGDFATKMLFFKIEEKYWNVLASLLLYLQRMPESIPELNVYWPRLSPDKYLIQVLREL